MTNVLFIGYINRDKQPFPRAISMERGYFSHLRLRLCLKGRMKRSIRPIINILYLDRTRETSKISGRGDLMNKRILFFVIIFKSDPPLSTHD